MYIRTNIQSPLRLGVRTPLFQGGNAGSSPAGDVMSLRLWRKMKSISKRKGTIYKQSQILHAYKYTNKQKKLLSRTKTFYSGEMNRLMNKYVMQRLYRKNMKGFSTHQTAESTTFMPNMHKTGDFFLSKRNFWRQHWSCTASFAQAKAETQINLLQTGSLTSLKEDHVSAMLKKEQQFLWRYTPVVGLKTKFKVHLFKKPWFFQNPSAVPGVLKMRRTHHLYGSTANNTRILSIWLGRVNNKIAFSLCNYSFSSAKNGFLWNTIFSLESYWPLVLTKAGYRFNIRTARQHLALQASTCALQQKKYLLNGQYISKVWAKTHPADILIKYKNNS